LVLWSVKEYRRLRNKLWGGWRPTLSCSCPIQPRNEQSAFTHETKGEEFAWNFPSCGIRVCWEIALAVQVAPFCRYCHGMGAVVRL
jgi:hypothetical protein